MADAPVVVVGAGPAGLRAAIELARAGVRVILADQSPGIGGAVYARLRSAATGKASGPQREMDALRAAFGAQAQRIELRCETAFAGIDSTGAALLTGKGGELLRPRALVLATGARELVRPRPGWTHPQVTTAGAVQVALKTGGAAPSGRIVLAGTGPLLYAIGAQLVEAGTPPVAIIEAGRPYAHPVAALGLPRAVIREAAGYMLTLGRARVPLLFGTRLLRIEDAGGEMRLETSHTGRFGTILADHLALHDGIARNDYGLPDAAEIPIQRAGDCREVLGRWAAEEDGIRAARAIIAQLGVKAPHPAPRSLARHRAAQRRLATLFALDGPALAPPPDETVLCRCEGRTMADLRAAAEPGDTPRTLRLMGRFGMGPCQGRFCLDWVAEFAGPPFEIAALRGQRWPIRPVSIADIVNAPDRRPETNQTETET
jgi:D-hydroxyproline dehydrogenase subunit alpha